MSNLQPDSPTFDQIRDEYRAFRLERDWEKFQDPKSVILALVGEVGELAELFQWVPAEEAVEHFAEGRSKERVGEEMADVLLYLTSLADTLGIDLMRSAHAKLAAARQRFPVAEYRGRAPLHQ